MVRFLEANFNLRKWRTNDERLRQIIDESKEVNISDNVGDKLLGIPWNEYTDTFEIDISEFVPANADLKFTKRKILKVIAGFYDPVGFIQPVIVQ